MNSKSVIKIRNSFKIHALIRCLKYYIRNSYCYQLFFRSLIGFPEQERVLPSRTPGANVLFRFSVLSPVRFNESSYFLFMLRIYILFCATFCSPPHFVQNVFTLDTLDYFTREIVLWNKHIHLYIRFVFRVYGKNEWN